MAKITIDKEGEAQPAAKETPSDNGLVYVADAKSRKIGLRQPEFLEEYRILQVVGPERAANQVYMGMVNPLLYIAEIDGETVSIPRTHAQVEALIKKAGREGFIAASLGIKNHFSGDNAALEEQIKNLLGTPDSETAAG